METELNDSLLKVLFSEKMASRAFPFGKIHSDYIEKKAYIYLAKIMMQEPDEKKFSDEYDYLYNWESCRGENGGIDSFKVLRWFAEQVLILNNKDKSHVDIRIHHTQTNLWNRVYHDVGQDLLTCAYVASKVLDNSVEASDRLEFDWPSVILSNDDKLNNILSKGIAENHFHLEASTQIFPLMWACMMNYPLDVCKELGKEGMHEGFELEEEENDEETESQAGKIEKEQDFYDIWIRRLTIAVSAGRKKEGDKDLFGIIRNAAILRILLFQKLCMPDKDTVSLFKQYRADPFALENWSLIEIFRKGDYLPEGEKHDWLRNLDYAISDKFYDVNPDLPGRLLASERSFLYHCFMNVFSERWNRYEKDLFYAYLLLKMRIRKRYVDTDVRRGFSHFKEIQDKKKEIKYARKDFYNHESYRLSILNNLIEYNISSLEARIMSVDSPSRLKKHIKDIDDQIMCAERSEIDTMYEKFGTGKKELTEYERTLERIFGTISGRGTGTKSIGIEDRYFYTVHIARKRNNDKSTPSPLESREELRRMDPILRNGEMRRKAREAVKSLDKYFNGWSDYTGNIISAIRDNERRIYGLDVCSFESECRPDVFATDFRFIRTADKRCGRTYHVGEDFESIISGLRAVDEAIHFLELQDGDRLGHALALGMDVKLLMNYRKVEPGGMVMYLRKQDILDDIVWLLYRSKEFEINIDNELSNSLKNTAEELFWSIYEGTDQVNWTKLSSEELLEKYYCSWKLRGDHPFLYQTKKYVPLRQTVYTSEYNNCMKSGIVTDEIREDNDIAYLCYLYHYSSSVKENGDIKKSVKLNTLSETLLDLITEMQMAICRDVSQRGLSIECNPTSNYRIAGMKSYTEHPIDVFCKVNSSRTKDSVRVSINTDDLGIFDTSLPHEYLVVKDALAESGKYSEADIYVYLDSVRKMGMDMSFRKLKM